MTTIAESTKEELMEPCKFNGVSCVSGMKALYFCKDDRCPSHLSQPTYCDDCYDEDRHPRHPPPFDKNIKIAKEVNNWKSIWTKLMVDI